MPEEFFPGYRIEADSSYFVNACDELTEEEQRQVKQEFADRLNDNEVNFVCLHMIISAISTIKSIINGAAKVK